MSRLRLVARVGGNRSPRTVFLAGSAMVHLLLVAVVTWMPSFRSAPAPSEDLIRVRLSPGVPSSRPVVAPPAPPEVEAPPIETKPAEGVRVEPRLPEPQAVPKPTSKRPKPKQPAASPSAAPATGEPAAARPPAPGEAGAGPAGAEIASLDFEDVEFAWYRDRVSAALKSHWRQPILEGIHDSLAVTLSFRILEDGSVRDARIETSSGVPSLDRSALRAVIEADPLPPLPPTWRERTMSARYHFQWNP